jgi:hypothetical protein
MNTISIQARGFLNRCQPLSVLLLGTPKRKIMLAWNHFSEPLVQWIKQLTLAMRMVLVTTLSMTPRFGGIEGLATGGGGGNLK